MPRHYHPITTPLPPHYHAPTHPLSLQDILEARLEHKKEELDKAIATIAAKDKQIEDMSEALDTAEQQVCQGEHFNNV